MNTYFESYEHMAEAIKDLLESERDLIANFANISAIIFSGMERLNWAGFYLMKEEELVLGPFQGLPACIRIKPGKGVCGTAVEQRRTIVVDDVHKFPGHIACDSNSNSEIVLPLFKDDRVFGVLDIDSPELSRFAGEEREILERIAGMINGFLMKYQ